jgi:hypothetical protein
MKMSYRINYYYPVQRGKNFSRHPCNMEMELPSVYGDGSDSSQFDFNRSSFNQNAENYYNSPQLSSHLKESSQDFHLVQKSLWPFRRRM